MAFQLSVFLENKIGHLGRVTSILREADINIRAMTLSHTAQGWGILNLIVSNPNKAREALVDGGISAVLRRVTVVEMEDRPGGLDDMLKVIAGAGVNFTNAYGRIVESGKKAFLAIDAEDIQQCDELLAKAGLRIIPDHEVYGNGH